MYLSAILYYTHYVSGLLPLHYRSPTETHESEIGVFKRVLI